MKGIIVLFGFVLFQICAGFKVPVTNEVLSKKPTNVPLAGVDLLGSGFNALTGQANLLPVFSFKYSQGKTWVPPYAPGITYSVPDEVSVSATGESKEIIVQDVYDRYQDFLETYRSSFTFSIGFSAMKNAFSLGFKYDKELYRVQHELSNNSIAQGHSKHWWSLYQVQGLPAFLQTLDPTIQAGFQSLPATIKSAADAAKYDSFFQYWGTHYVSMANYGAYAHQDTFVSVDIVQKMSLQWVSTQMGLQFHYAFFNISAGGFHNKSDIHVDNTFAQHSQSFQFFEGGDPTLQSTTTLSQWVATIEAQPHYLNCTLRPLSELIADATTKNTMATAMNSFIQNNGSVSLTDFGIQVHPHAHPAPEPVLPKPQLLEPVVPEPLLSPIFGSDVVGCGYDASTDTFGLLPVVGFTYKQQQVWTNPIYPQYKYLVPDQVEIANLPESFLLDATFVEQTAADYMYQFEQKTHSHHCGLFGCSSKSKDLKEYYNYYFGENRSMAMSIKYISWYSLTNAPFPPPAPDSTFAQAINALPQVYGASPANQNMYQQFLKSWGTGYVASAVFGGMIVNKQWYHSCLERIYSQTWLQQQSSWGFLGIIGDGHGKTYNDTRVSISYANDRLSVTEVFGGDQTIPADQWANWIPTVKLQPFPLQYTVLPFTDLIADPTKQASMDQAITDYMNAAGVYAQQLIKQIAASNTNHQIPAACHV